MKKFKQFTALLLAAVLAMPVVSFAQESNIDTAKNDISYAAQNISMDEFSDDSSREVNDGYEITNTAHTLYSLGASISNIEWHYNSGILTISGTGKMEDYDSSNRPEWEQYKDEITSIKVTNGVTSIGELAFYGYSNLESIELPASLTSIGRISFAECTLLDNVVIPDKVTVIPYGAFADCYGLRNISYNNIVTIEDYAFQCNNIDTVTINSKLADIQSLAFFGASIKKYEAVNNSKYKTKDGIIFTDGGRTLYAYPSANERTSYVVPGTVTKIADSAFVKNKNLKSLTIGNSVTSLGSSACQDMDSLLTIRIPDSVTQAGDFTFFGCDELTAVTFGKGLKESSYQMFRECPMLTTINFGTGLQTLGGHTFAYCTSLTSVVLPSTIKVLGVGCFGECYALKSFKSTAITNVPYSAFWNCHALSNVTLNNGVTDIYRCAFYRCNSLMKITVPRSTKFIETDAFPATTVITCANPNMKHFGINGYRYLDSVSITGTRKYSMAYKVLTRVNTERAKKGLKALKMDKGMLETAMRRAAETAVCFAHTRPDGSICFTANSEMIAENIAVNQKNDAEVMNSWMNSQGHKENILSEDAQSIGIGCYVQNGIYYWTQCFSAKQLSSNCAKPADCSKTQTISIAAGTFDEATSDTGVIFGEEKKYTYKYTVKLNSTKIKAHTTAKATMYLVNPGFTYASTALNNSCIKWSSNKTNIATVSSKGIITGKNAGKCAIVGRLKFASTGKTLQVLTNLNAAQVKAIKGVITKAKRKSSKASVAVKKVSGISGYQIQIATNSKMTQSKKTVKTTKTSYTFSKLKLSKKYYVRVRVYKKIGSKTYYGKWSTVKRVRK